jgi:flavin prenyltransferase
MPDQKRLVVAVTGASGAIYAIRFLRHAAPRFDRISVIFSSQAPTVFEAEIGRALPSPPDFSSYLGDDQDYSHLTLLDPRDYMSPPASGSYRHDGMVVIPCSMGTLGRIAGGISNDLITRAADVALKERRKLILVTRDTPLNLIQIRNMAAVTEAGAIVLPASPSFYGRPTTVDDLVDTVVARVLQNLGVDQTLQAEWGVSDNGES